MAYTKTGGACRIPPASPKAIVGRDRLNWRHADVRLFLHFGNNQSPLVAIEPEPKHSGMYRIRSSEGGLSDMMGLTRAKDAAIALALRSLNSGAQETPKAAPYVRQKGAAVGDDGDSLCEAPNGFLAEGGW